MKHVISKVCAFLMSLTLLVGLMPTIDAEAYAGTETGSIEITGAEPDDILQPYKIIEITYDSTSNTVTYAWVDAIKEAFKKNDNSCMTVEEYARLTDAKKKEWLAKVHVKLTDEQKYGNAITVSDEGKAEWDNVPLGGYLIVPTSSTNVYQMMLAVVQPEMSGNASDYVTTSVTITAKKEAVSIDKQVDDDTTGDSKVITYTILADVPTYEDGAIDTTYIIGDKLSSGLEIDETQEDYFKVYGYTVSKETILAETTATELGEYDATKYYSVTKGGKLNDEDEENQTFMLTFNYAKLKNANNGKFKTIKIVYKAKINEEAVLGTVDSDANATGNLNEASMKYTHYPFTTENYKTTTDTVRVYTFGITINKVASESDDIKLSGAIFDVYLEVNVDANGNLTDTTIDAKNTNTIVTSQEVSALPSNKKYIKVGTTGATAEDGTTTLENLDAGTYALVETKAPNGYTLLGNSVSIVISKDSSQTGYSASSGIHTQKVENASGFTLPQTGGSGTVVFTIVGISLMLAAVVVFFVLRRKETHKK